MLHDPLLEEVLLVLQYDAAFSHEYGVRAHIIEVLRAVCPQNGLLSILVIDPNVATLRSRMFSHQTARLLFTGRNGIIENVHIILAHMYRW